jgi:hypothetical protein
MAMVPAQSVVISLDVPVKYLNDYFDVYSRYDINIATYEHFGVNSEIKTDQYNPIDTTTKA